MSKFLFQHELIRAEVNVWHLFSSPQTAHESCSSLSWPFFSSVSVFVVGALFELSNDIKAKWIPTRSLIKHVLWAFLLCLSLRVTKEASLSACRSTATLSVFLTATWLLIWTMPQREWTSLSISWTRRALTVRRLQELLTTGEQLHRIQLLVYGGSRSLRGARSCSHCVCTRTHFSACIKSGILQYLLVPKLLFPLSFLPPERCSGLEISTSALRTTACTSSGPASTTKTTACCGPRTRSDPGTESQHELVFGASWQE